MASRITGRLRLLLSPRSRRHQLVGPAHLWKLKRDFQIRFLRDVGLQPGRSLLDLGCGTLRGGLPLIAFLDKGDYAGVEARPEVLREGRVELARAELDAKEPELIAEADFGRVRLQRRFDFVWAFSLVMHLTDEILEDCFACARAHLAEDGVFYANVLEGDAPPAAWREFPVIARSLATYREAGARHGLALENLGSLAGLGHRSGIESQDQQLMLGFRP